MKLLFIKLSAYLFLAALACFASANQRAAGTKFAPELARVRLRVMTYNIHVGFGMDKKLDLARIARVITDARPDLVALQEVDRGVRRTNGIDEIAELARLTRMEYAFAPNLDYQGGKYGVAILSRFPILSIDHRRYANKREAERRGLIRVELMVKGQKINFVTTHLDYQYTDGRLFEAEQLLKALGEVKGPMIVAGDFNDEPTGTSYKLMLTNFTDAWDATARAIFDEQGYRAANPSWTKNVVGTGGQTYPSDKPVKRIDYIFVRKDRGLSAIGAFLPVTLASDHLPLVVDLELR